MEAQQWLTAYFDRYTITPNITYKTVNGLDLKLDLYTLREPQGPNPIVVYYHGGGWVEGTKEEALLWGLLPYMVRGWSLVNVEYRMARTAPAPAAVEDCLAALAWTFKNSELYLFDRNRIFTTGFSAGGHLALMSGMLAAFMDLKEEISLQPPVPLVPIHQSPVAAIINWYGVTDVADMLEGPNIRDYAQRWFMDLPNPDEIAHKVSPLNHVKKGIPPVITLHGDADLSVPYSHAVRLHEALDREGIINTLVTVPGGGHAYFPPDENIRIFEVIWEFLEKHASIR